MKRFYNRQFASNYDELISLVLCGFFRNLLRKPCLEDGLRASDKEQRRVLGASVVGSLPSIPAILPYPDNVHRSCTGDVQVHPSYKVPGYRGTLSGKSLFP